MEITKQNEIYQINDSTEKYNISGSLNINSDNSYSFNISMTDANNSKTMSYYKTVTSDHIDVNSDGEYEINGQKVKAADLMEAFYELFVK